MSIRGVTISSLLSGTHDETDGAGTNGGVNREDSNNSKPNNSNGNSVKNLVSMFQPNIKIGGPESPMVIIDDDPPTIPDLPYHKETSVGTVNIAPKIKSNPNPVDLSKQIKKFQTDFQFDIPNKASISSIMNVDAPPPQVISSPTPIAPAVAPKSPKKKVQKKEVKKPPTKDKKEPAKRKAEPKKLSTNKKAKTTPEPKPVKPVEVINLPPPELIDINGPKEPSPDKPVEKPKDNREPPKELELGKKEEIKELPIIALNIPLLDPKKPQPGQAEVVVNVLKLAEDKYGWSTVHPNAKSALEVLDDSDDDLEEDDKDDEDEKEEKEKPEKPEEKEKEKEKDGKEKKELTEEQLVRQHETRMNRKVGKYDYLDPFIDDNELELEEGITSTKEGFFVYWGPIVDDRAKKPTKGKR